MARERELFDDDDDVFGDEEEDTLKDMFLTFSLGDEEYGIEIRQITEIIAIQKITEVPDMPSFVKGVINLRGYVIPVIDMRLRFQLPAREYGERTCVIVVSIEETMVGLVVDTVEDVLSIPEEDITPPPEMLRGASSRYIQGMGKVDDNVKIILNVERLLYDREKEQLGATLPT